MHQFRVTEEPREQDYKQSISKYLEAKIQSFFKFDPNHPTEVKGEKLAIPRKGPIEVLKQMRNNKFLVDFRNMLNLRDSLPIKNLAKKDPKQSVLNKRSKSVCKMTKCNILPPEATSSEVNQ